MPKKRFSKLTSDDLNDPGAWPFSDGADEITIRVSSYEDDGKTPASFQVIVRGKDRHQAWGLGILANPVAALHRAIDDYYSPGTQKPVEDVADEPEPSATDLLR